MWNAVGTMATSHHCRAPRSVTFTSHDTSVAPSKVCFGENHPVAPNDGEGNRARNRRVEIAPVPRPNTLRGHAEAAR